jgi:hypothetical protein
VRFLGVLVDAVAEAGASPTEMSCGELPIFRFSDEREFASLLRDQELEDIDVRTISFSHAEPSADAPGVDCSVGPSGPLH